MDDGEILTPTVQSSVILHYYTLLILWFFIKDRKKLTIGKFNPWSLCENIRGYQQKMNLFSPEFFPLYFDKFFFIYDYPTETFGIYLPFHMNLCQALDLLTVIIFVSLETFFVYKILLHLYDLPGTRHINSIVTTRNTKFWHFRIHTLQIVYNPNS